MNLKKIFAEEKSIKILKNSWFKSIGTYIIMSKENISQEIRLKNIYETRNYFLEEINQ